MPFINNRPKCLGPGFLCGGFWGLHPLHQDCRYNYCLPEQALPHPRGGVQAGALRLPADRPANIHLQPDTLGPHTHAAQQDL